MVTLSPATGPLHFLSSLVNLLFLWLLLFTWFSPSPSKKLSMPALYKEKSLGILYLSSLFLPS